MWHQILTAILAPFRQPFHDYPGAFVGIAILCCVAGFGVGRLPGAYRRRVLEERLRRAKEQVQRSEAEGRRLGELLGVTAKGRAPLMRLTNQQLRAKTETFVSSLRAQLAAWQKEAEARLAHGPAARGGDETDEARTRAWSQATRRLLAESSTQLATYQDRFKVDAVMLRIEIARRLDRPAERTAEATTRVSSPVDLSAMEDIASDLEALVQLLPGDGASRAAGADSRRRAPRRT